MRDVVSIRRLPQGIVLLTPRGGLDAVAAEALDRAFHGLFLKGSFRCVARLDRVTDLSSAAAAVLIGVCSRARRNRGDLILLRPSAAVLRVFRLLELPEAPRMAGDLRDAVRMLALPQAAAASGS